MVKIDDRTLLQANIANVIEDLFRNTISNTEAVKKVYKIAVDFDVVREE